MQFDLFDGSRNQILGATVYADFKETLARSNCARCPLSSSRTQIVVDRGNPQAKVLMIGEAPGENEDLQGRAFVGRAGKLLDELMREVGFNTETDGLIINVVKCRPPENRAPAPKEVEACFPFLKKQIELVNPRLILLLGATALKHMVPDKEGSSMKREVGIFFTHAAYPGVELMVLYHPAYLLRDPRKRPLMAEHLARFRERWARGLENGKEAKDGG
ncbi:MAG: uracil-DNA glycosylase [Candidatus Omnitrophica bacterium]|nr:uracil-DNA glycosylase [Candidatus Omnitrophota bacterium]